MALQCRVYAPIFISLCDFGAVPFYLEHVCMLGEAICPICPWPVPLSGNLRDGVDAGYVYGQGLDLGFGCTSLLALLAF